LWEAGEDCKMRNVITCTLQVKDGDMDGARMGRMTNAEFWSENLKGRDYSEDLGEDKSIISEWILGKRDGKVLCGCIRLQDRNKWGWGAL